MIKKIRAYSPGVRLIREKLQRQYPTAVFGIYTSITGGVLRCDPLYTQLTMYRLWADRDIGELHIDHGGPVYLHIDHGASDARHTR